MSKHSLEIQINQYLDRLMRPKAEFNGHSICPSMAEHRKNIGVKIITCEFETQIEDTIDVFRMFKYSAVVCGFENITADEICKITNKLINYTKFDDIELLVSDPTLKGKVRGVYTGFKKAPLLIIQSRSLLEAEQKKYREKGYYKAVYKDGR